MSSFKPEVQEYVEEIVFEYLYSITDSKEMEDRYRILTAHIKSASTTELRRIAKRFSKHILDNAASLAELSNLSDDDLIAETLTKAIENDDQ